MATIEAQREADERNRLIGELKSRRATKAAELEKLDRDLERLADGDFMARVGKADLRTLTTREKSEIVSKLGQPAFEQLVYAQRR